MSAKRPNRIALGNLIESLDYMDATRSHEFAPSRRLQSRYASRRALHLIVATFAGLGVLMAMGAMN